MLGAGKTWLSFYFANQTKFCNFPTRNAKMNILVTIPSFAKHGGIRVLIEHANGLAEFGHDITIHCYQANQNPDWIEINPDIQIVYGNAFFMRSFDAVIAGSPHLAIDLYEKHPPEKIFLLLQMAEEIFNPTNKPYVDTVIRAYNLPITIIGISQWNKEEILFKHGRNPELPYHIIGNGVSSEFYQDETKREKQLTVLVEGWIGYNPAKDTDAIGPKVAKRLKEQFGAKIIAYSQFPKDATRFGNLPFLQYQDVPDEYYIGPDTQTIANLYRRAHFLLKASKYDARACAPVEAMACGTPTARALILGDDDLIHRFNCLRCGYDEHDLFTLSAMLCDPKTRNEIAVNGLEYAQENLSWEKHTRELERIILEQIK